LQGYSGKILEPDTGISRSLPEKGSEPPRLGSSQSRRYLLNCPRIAVNPIPAASPELLIGNLHIEFRVQTQASLVVGLHTYNFRFRNFPVKSWAEYTFSP